MKNIDIGEVLCWSCGGVHQRREENFELWALLEREAPEFLASHPQVSTWLESNDAFLAALATGVKK